MEHQERRIKCRFCDYTVMPFYTTKDGKVKNGMDRLQNHIEDEHPNEYDRIYEAEREN